MALVLGDCSFSGPALPEPFVKLELDDHLVKAKLLAKRTGAEAKRIEDGWEVVRKKLRLLGEHGGAVRVANHVLEPLLAPLGYATVERTGEVKTSKLPDAPAQMSAGGIFGEVAIGREFAPRCRISANAASFPAARHATRLTSASMTMWAPALPARALPAPALEPTSDSTSPATLH
jgi:hypothetical protein